MIKKYIRYFENLERYNMSFKKRNFAASEREKNSQRIRRLVVCAMLSALSAVILLLGNLIGIADISALCIVSVATVVCAVEMGSYYPYLLWIAVSVISFFILPDKILASEYFLFAGIYPMIKRITYIFKQPYAFILRILYFNLCAGITVVLMKFVFIVQDTSSIAVWILTFVMFNLVFVVYDLALNSVTAFYILKIRRKIHAEKI